MHGIDGSTIGSNFIATKSRIGALPAIFRPHLARRRRAISSLAVRLVAARDLAEVANPLGSVSVGKIKRLGKANVENAAFASGNMARVWPRPGSAVAAQQGCGHAKEPETGHGLVM